MRPCCLHTRVAVHTLTHAQHGLINHPPPLIYRLCIDCEPQVVCSAAAPCVWLAHTLFPGQSSSFLLFFLLLFFFTNGFVLLNHHPESVLGVHPPLLDHSGSRKHFSLSTLSYKFSLYIYYRSCGSKGLFCEEFDLFVHLYVLSA